MVLSCEAQYAFTACMSKTFRIQYVLIGVSALCRTTCSILYLS